MTLWQTAHRYMHVHGGWKVTLSWWMKKKFGGIRDAFVRELPPSNCLNNCLLCMHLFRNHLHLQQSLNVVDYILIYAAHYQKLQRADNEDEL